MRPIRSTYFISADKRSLNEEERIVRAVIIEEPTLLRAMLEKGKNRENVCDRCFDTDRPTVAVVLFFPTSTTQLDSVARRDWILCSICLCLLKECVLPLT